jgi:hypothetical protein
VEQARALGVDRLVFGLPPDGADVVLPILDKLADLADLGQV